MPAVEASQPAALPVNFAYTAGRFLPLKLRAILDFAAPRPKARLLREKPPLASAV